MVGSPRQWPKWHRPRTSPRPQRERERVMSHHTREAESCHIIQGKHLLDQSMLQGCVKGHRKVPVNYNFFEIFLTIFLFYLQLYKYRLVFFFFLFCNLTSTSRLLTFTIFLTFKSSKTLQLLNDNKPSQLKGQCFSCISILTIMSHV